MRNSATRNILENRDVIIVASVSCIYGLGDVESYAAMTLPLSVGEEINPKEIYKRLAELQYERNQQNFVRSTFRVQGDTLDIFPAHYEDRAWRISFFGDEIESIYEFDSLTGKRTAELKDIVIYPANHYVTPRPAISQAIVNIKRNWASNWKNLPLKTNFWKRKGLNKEPVLTLKCWKRPDIVKGLKTTRVTLPDANPESRLPRYLNTCRRTPLFLLTKVTFPFPKSEECIGVTVTVKARFPTMVSACPPA